MADTPEIVTVQLPDRETMGATLRVSAQVVVGCGQDPKQCRAQGLLKDKREDTGDRSAVFCINTNLPFIGEKLKDPLGLKPPSFCGVEVPSLANAPKVQ